MWIKLNFKCLLVNGVIGDFWFDIDEKWGRRGDRGFKWEGEK